jgi:hypothetical protein
MHEVGYLSCGGASTHTTSFQAVTGDLVRPADLPR